MAGAYQKIDERQGESDIIKRTAKVGQFFFLKQMRHDIGVDFLIFGSPVCSHGLGLLVGWNGDSQIDQRHRMFDHLAVNRKFSVRVPVVIGFDRDFIFQGKLFFHKEILDILFDGV